MIAKLLLLSKTKISTHLFTKTKYNRWLNLKSKNKKGERNDMIDLQN